MALIDIEIPYNFTARVYQRPMFIANKEGIIRYVLVWHRRAGKEKTCWNFTIMKALQKVGTYYYFFPTFSQGRKVLWDFIDKDGFRVLEHIPQILLAGKPNSTEMKIRLKNGSVIQIIGTDNIDGELCYEWEVAQDECKMFVFTVNGVKAKRVDELGMACYYLRDAMLDFLAHEEQSRIMIKGVEQ